MNIPKSNSVPAIIISDFDDENVLAKRKSLEVTKKKRTETSQAEPSDEELVQVQEKCEIFVKKDISGVGEGEKNKTIQKVGPCTTLYTEFIVYISYSRMLPMVQHLRLSQNQPR